LTVDEINRRIANAQWREGYHIGAFHPDTLNIGAQGGKPLPNKGLRLTAAQTLEFAFASEQLFKDAIPKDEPCWRSWLAHTDWLEIACRHNFTRLDPLHLDKAIMTHQQLFLQV